MSQMQTLAPVRRRTTLVLATLCLATIFVPFAAAQEKAKAGYPLALTPAVLLERLGKGELGPVADAGGLSSPDSEERKLLAKVWEARSSKPPIAGDQILKQPALLSAMLFASGVGDTGSHAKYHKLYAELVSAARQAVGTAKSPAEKGEKLMQFLHQGVMAKGYESEQTSLAEVIDTGKFNCVSATALYYLVGKELGLDLHAIGIPGNCVLPGHATIDLLASGKRIEVETTNPDGFDWGTKSKQPGVIVLGFVPDRKEGRPVDALGLAAMIYGNRGVGLAKVEEANKLAALQCYAAALALDPTNPTASHNVVTEFVNAGPKLADDGKFEEALKMLTFGQAVAPSDRSLANNLELVWSRYVDCTLDAGQDKEALALLKRAARDLPEEKDFQKPEHWYARLGDRAKDKEGWPAALAVAERGLKAAPDAAEGLKKWRSDAYRQWSQSLLEKKEVEESAKVLAEGLALDPKDRNIQDGIAYHVQEALRILDADQGAPAVVAHQMKLLERFPKIKKVCEGGHGHVHGVVDRLADEGKYAEAIAAVASYQAMLSDKDVAGLGATAYDAWARSLAKDQQWQAALDKYLEGLKAHPGNKRLTGNAVATIDEWARISMDAKQWTDAIAIYEIGLKHFPKNGHLEHNRKYCDEQRKLKD